MTDPTERFSSRVSHYAQYRPSYPREVLATLRNECRLTPGSLIADIGSGTGFLSKLFLENGNRVFAVEPNPGMRDAGEALLKTYPGFQSVGGRAETTGLPGDSIDFVIAGQAFHWFDLDACRIEFSRILKPNGTVMIVWNERDTGSTPFLVAYEKLLARHVPDYPEMNYRQVYADSVREFFGPGSCRSRTFRYHQELDLEGTKGRLLSSSYTPYVGHSHFVPMMECLTQIFNRHQTGGRVSFEYTTRMYYGQLPQ
jgi:SAM-dependent methyltransferase